MTESSNKPTAEQIAKKKQYPDGSHNASWRAGWRARDEEVATRDLAVEAAAYEKAKLACDKSMTAQWRLNIVTGMYELPADYRHPVEAISALLTPPHTLALAAHDVIIHQQGFDAGFEGAERAAFEREREYIKHDREREDRMLKRFEELAGRWQWASNLKTTLPESDAQKCGWSQCANELLSTIASIREERE